MVRLSLHPFKVQPGAVFLILFIVGSTFGQNPSADRTKVLPGKVGTFSQVGAVRPLDPVTEQLAISTQALLTSSGECKYVSGRGEQLSAQIIQLRRDADAYSLLTLIAVRLREKSGEPAPVTQDDIGTASARVSGKIAFFKGSQVAVIWMNNHTGASTTLTQLATLLAERLNKGDGDIPPLVRHLPGGDEPQKTAQFFSGLTSGNFTFLNQQALTAIDGKGDADAVLAKVGPSKVLLVEFNTPQLATENDQRIVAKIHDLWNQGLPAPTAYRRVGNYSVFVFDSPNEETARHLIDGVKYEQVVQWLGDNPYLLKDAEKRYVETTMGVFIAVVKASGVAFISCFAAGGLFGALLFRKRRKQQRLVEAFSDAGGMLRLNLDELSAQSESARLIQGHN